MTYSSKPVIFIGADHRGFQLKNALIQWLRKKGNEIEDCGNTVYDPEDDYPDFVKKVVEKLCQQKTFLAEGILTEEHSCEITSGLSIASLPYAHSFVKPKKKDVDLRGVAPLRTDLTDRTPHLSKPTSEVSITEKDQSLGIVICGSGIGVSIAANRYKGIYCALGFSENQVRSGREHDHINVLALGSDYIDSQKAKNITETFIATAPITHAKYLRRIKKVDTVSSQY
ncbi:MAG TPA: RpiB/LacA/LacB family sugar-phosphate isomerase [Patescibacteria group bacterium]|nr:RpiB/LacA/LacB family sugar-phosphate isomerase [Patescibacteria group bacterium]